MGACSHTHTHTRARARMHTHIYPLSHLRVPVPSPSFSPATTNAQSLYNSEEDHIVTAASCTTNCLAPVVKVIHEQLGIVHGCITTIHNVTNTQTIVDAPNTKKTDLRRARSALCNLAPTSTGSATAIALIFPELKGKLNGGWVICWGGGWASFWVVQIKFLVGN
jgi:glyceraldehyde-3-phosphate dehydrogenase type I